MQSTEKSNNGSRVQQPMASLLTVPHLLALASKSSDESCKDGANALVAIVFAVAAFDGYLNEIAKVMVARLTSDPHKDHPRIQSLSLILPKLEEAHCQLELKLAVIDAVMGTEIWSAGTQPMQDLMLLVRLRNAIVHPRPLAFYQADEILPKHPDKIVAALVAKGIGKSAPKLPVLAKPWST